MILFFKKFKGLVVDLGANAHAYFDKQGGSLGASAYYVDDKNLKKDVGALISASPKKAELLVRTLKQLNFQV